MHTVVSVRTLIRSVEGLHNRAVYLSTNIGKALFLMIQPKHVIVYPEKSIKYECLFQQKEIFNLGMMHIF